MSAAEEAVRGRLRDDANSTAAARTAAAQAPARAADAVRGQPRRRGAAGVARAVVAALLLFPPLVSLCALLAAPRMQPLRQAQHDALTAELLALPDLSTADFRSHPWMDMQREPDFGQALFALVNRHGDDPRAWMLGYRLGGFIPPYGTVATFEIKGRPGLGVDSIPLVPPPPADLAHDAWWLQAAKDGGVADAPILLGYYKELLTATWHGSMRFPDGKPPPKVITHQQAAAMRQAGLQEKQAKLEPVLQSLRAAAPDDALPCYWTAHLYGLCGEYASALCFVREGNAKPQCRSLRGYPFDTIELGAALPEQGLWATGCLLRAQSQLQSEQELPHDGEFADGFKPLVDEALQRGDLDDINTLHRCAVRAALAGGTSPRELSNALKAEQWLVRGYEQAHGPASVGQFDQQLHRITLALSQFWGPSAWQATKFTGPWDVADSHWLRGVIRLSPESLEVWQLDHHLRVHERWQQAWAAEIEPALRELERARFGSPATPSAPAPGIISIRR